MDIESIIADLQENPRDTTHFEALCDLYTAATPDQRDQIRAFVASNRELVSALEHWSPPGLEDDPARRLELKLLSVSIRDGSPDWRDVLLRLAAEWYHAEEQGVDPAPIFRAAANLSNDQGEHHAKGLIRQLLREPRRKNLYDDLQRFMK